MLRKTKQSIFICCNYIKDKKYTLDFSRVILVIILILKAGEARIQVILIIF